MIFFRIRFRGVTYFVAPGLDNVNSNTTKTILSLGWCQWKTKLTKSYVDFSNYQLNAQFFYFSTIYMLHYAPQRVSSSTLLETCWGA